MGKKIDIKGEKFNKLLAIRPTELKTKDNKVIWEFLCDCGKYTYVRCSDVIRGNTKSCGLCLKYKFINAQNDNYIYDYVEHEDHVKINTSKGIYFVIDKDDFEKIKTYTWLINSCGYVATRRNKKEIKLHRFILNAPDNLHVDHINNNKLDNRKANIRLCTPQQNQCNKQKMMNCKSKYKGVTMTSYGKWIARIKCNQKRIYLGVYDSEKNAACAYNEKAVELFGEFAKLNVIDE